MYLNTHSCFSLRYGTMPPEILVEEAKKHGVEAMALTDINNTMGMVDYVKLCNEHNIKPLAGVEFRNGDKRLYTGIARNNMGFRELNEFISAHNSSGENYPEIPKGFENVIIIYPFELKPVRLLNEHEFIGIRPSEINRIISPDFCRYIDRSVILNPVTFRDESGYYLHMNLRAINHNTLISKLIPGQLASVSEKFTSASQLAGIFSEYPQIIRNTERIAEDCNISFDFNKVKNKRTFTDNPYDDKLLLEKLALDGLGYRYGMNNKEAKDRIDHELRIIDKMGFSSYFLITWDIIRYSMSRGFYHVGRGSGANSIVAYCLKITDVDPIELDLYFERFINPKRTSPPDFDIDYSWRDRDEVIDYIFKRYGNSHTALLGATVTFRDKSTYRELGKVYGLPKEEIDKLVENPEAEKNNNDITRKIYDIAQLMADLPNIRSIHAGGILISEEPITCYTALDMPPKGFQTTQWDMYVAEDLRFEKLDILSQRGIGHIRECAEIVSVNREVSVDVHQVAKFKKDEQVKRQLKSGETTGCFYIESPAMRGLLKKLRCDNYLSLVAASSIIRPGVARSGMMREYIFRFHNPGKFKYIHPIMEEQLKETYGVMVYQEDVLKICHHFAGLDLADADVLRRAMSGKFRGKKEMKRIVEKFFSNCREKGYPEEIINEVWRQIDSFAGYSFSKAHSASYAAESYQSLYLKAYYPLEFMVAVINNFGGYYRTWVYFNEAKRCGAGISLPCVNHSDYKTNIYGTEVYIGFIHIMGLEAGLGIRIEVERKRNGWFFDLVDFIQRVSPGLEQLVLLIRTGALRFTGKSKPQLLWESHLHFGKTVTVARSAFLFHEPVRQFELPALVQTSVEDFYDELELLDFPVSCSYFDMLKTRFRGEIKAGDMINNIGKTVRMLGLYVTVKYVWTIKKEIMHFGTFFDDEGCFFDTVHFPSSLKDYPFRGRGVYLLKGTITAEFGFPSLTVEKMAKLPIEPDPRGR
ncbi:MAG: DNA polymerase III subunit alpha [Bacteroidia bacterium]|nr:DNA polymerase III subunit alpha [Bacteroidia bacterium]